MNIDEFIKIYIDKIKPIKENLSKISHRKFKELERMNQTVYVRDMIVRHPYDNSFGEANAGGGKYFKRRFKQPTLERLKAHIGIIFNLANQDHRANHCERIADGSYQIKQDKVNHITRLSTPEFSFYTKKPLTMQEYMDLYECISDSNFPLDPNVHILLSSFSVLNEQGELLNMSMFIEGGDPTNVYSFAKNTASHVDVDYGKSTKLFSQVQDNESTTPSYVPTTIATQQGNPTYTGSVFELKTAGGACFTQTIDVCKDHFYGYSKRQMEQRIMGNAREDEVIPHQIEQCVTSNYIELIRPNILSDRITHVDPFFSMLDEDLGYHYADFDVRQGKRALNLKHIKEAMPRDYPTNIVDSKRGYKIIHPPFGADYSIELMAERPVGKFKPALRQNIAAHNTHAIAQKLIAAQQKALTADEKTVVKVAMEDNIQHCIAKRLIQMENKLLNRCNIGLFEKLFKTRGYVEKVLAKSLIDDRLNFMKEVVETRGDNSLFLIKGWKNDFVYKLHVFREEALNSNDKTLYTQLINDIEDIIDVDLTNDLQCSFDSPPDDLNHPSL